MSKYSDKHIIDSWQHNVRPWLGAINGGEIESRLLVTNQAIIDAVLQRRPRSVLDVGCGEGWLARALEGAGVSVLGVDAVPAFIAHARQAGLGRFEVLAFEEVCAARLNERFDVLVCNFSLLGKESVTHVFQQVASLLNEGGAFIVQTLHPQVACAGHAYQDGWREGSWAGFSELFTDPAPWYFRTLDSWQALFTDNGLSLHARIEPVNPKTNAPASIIFIAVPNGL